MPKPFTDGMMTETMIAIHQLRCDLGGYIMPTKRELAAEMGLSYCAIQNRLEKLQSARRIELDTDRNSRGIKFTVKTIKFNGVNIPVLGECS